MYDAPATSPDIVIVPLGGAQAVGLVKVPVMVIVMLVSVKVKILDEQPVVFDVAYTLV